MGSEKHLATPWLRTQVAEALRLLANADWLITRLGIDGSGSEALDRVLDLLDDTGAVDEPQRQVGAFNLDAEVAYARSLGRALDGALGSNDPGRWTEVSRAAEHLLAMLDRSDEISR